MKYFFRFIMKITPLERSKPLTMGGIYHDAIEMYYKTAKGKVDLNAIEAVKEFIANKCAEKSKYLESNEDVIIQGMVQGYVHRYANSAYEMVDNEVLFDIPYGINYHRCGKIDAKLKSNGQLFLGEWKTTGQIDTYVKKIQTDNQANNYLWAFENEAPTGVVFRIARKSLLRIKKDETIAQYRDRILDDYLSRPNENFHEEVVFLDKIKLARWKHEVESYKEMIQMFTEKECWYRNTGACWNYGSKCPYFAICDQTTVAGREEIKAIHYAHCEPGEELFAIKE